LVSKVLTLQASWECFHLSWSDMECFGSTEHLVRKRKRERQREEEEKGKGKGRRWRERKARRMWGKRADVQLHEE